MIWIKQSPPPPSRANPRLARYDGRVARVLRDGQQTGWLLAIASWCARQRGHLWWARLDPSEHAAEVWCYLPGPEADHEGCGTSGPEDAAWQDFVVTGAEALEAELDDWDAGQLCWLGDVCDVEWLAPEESAAVALRIFDWTEADRTTPGAPLGRPALHEAAVRDAVDAVLDDLRPLLGERGVDAAVEVRRTRLHHRVWRVRVRVVTSSGVVTHDHHVARAAVPATRSRPAAMSLEQTALALRDLLEAHASGGRPASAPQR